VPTFYKPIATTMPPPALGSTTDGGDIGTEAMPGLSFDPTECVTESRVMPKLDVARIVTRSRSKKQLNNHLPNEAKLMKKPSAPARPAKKMQTVPNKPTPATRKHHSLAAKPSFKELFMATDKTTRAAVANTTHAAVKKRIADTKRCVAKKRPPIQTKQRLHALKMKAKKPPPAATKKSPPAATILPTRKHPPPAANLSIRVPGKARNKHPPPAANLCTPVAAKASKKVTTVKSVVGKSRFANTVYDATTKRQRHVKTTIDKYSHQVTRNRARPPIPFGNRAPPPPSAVGDITTVLDSGSSDNLCSVERVRGGFAIVSTKKGGQFAQAYDKPSLDILNGDPEAKKAMRYLKKFPKRGVDGVTAEKQSPDERTYVWEDKCFIIGTEGDTEAIAIQCTKRYVDHCNVTAVKPIYRYPKKTRFIGDITESPMRCLDCLLLDEDVIALMRLSYPTLSLSAMCGFREIMETFWSDPYYGHNLLMALEGPDDEEPDNEEPDDEEPDDEEPACVAEEEEVTSDEEETPLHAEKEPKRQRRHEEVLLVDSDLESYNGETVYEYSDDEEEAGDDKLNERGDNLHEHVRRRGTVPDHNSFLSSSSSSSSSDEEEDEDDDEVLLYDSDEDEFNETD
jgi:hypothetical protein